MAVVVDNISYPLESNNTFPILFSGQAPLAQSGYQYAKVRIGNESALAEPFLRQPVNESTPHEFFNRTWNTHENAKFPQVYPPLDSIHRIQSNLHRDNEIPTIHIVGNDTMIDMMNKNITGDIKVESSVTYLSLHDAFQFEGVEVSLAGRSSRKLAKLSYNLKLKKKDDLYGYRRLKLRALYLDASYIREQVSYDFIKSVGLIASEFSYVRVFMNNQELGLFGIIDTFKGNWLSNVFADGSSSYDNGYLYQGSSNFSDASVQNFSSIFTEVDNKTAYEDSIYALKENASGGKKDNYDPLTDFLKFVAEAPSNSSDAVRMWNEKLDMNSFLRSMALEALGGYSDGYLATANNYNLYQLPDSGQFVYIPYDMDMTLGFNMPILKGFVSGNYSKYPGMSIRPLMAKVMQVPEFNAEYKQLIQNLTAQLVNPEITKDRISSLVSMLKEDFEWDRYLPRVSKDYLAEGFVSQNTIKIGSQSFNIGDGGDLIQQFKNMFSFEAAVYGPTGSIISIGVQEWITDVHRNTTQFYSQK